MSVNEDEVGGKSEGDHHQGEEKAYTERTRRQEIPDQAVQAFTDYLCSEGTELDYTAIAIGEDWIRFSLLIHMVKPHNYDRAADGAAHLVGRLFDNLLNQRPEINAIIETCRQTFQSMHQFTHAIKTKFGTQLRRAVKPLLDKPSQEDKTWNFIARFLNSIKGLTAFRRRDTERFIIEHCMCSGYCFTAASNTIGQNNIPAM